MLIAINSNWEYDLWHSFCSYKSHPNDPFLFSLVYQWFQTITAFFLTQFVDWKEQSSFYTKQDKNSRFTLTRFHDVVDVFAL